MKCIKQDVSSIAVVKLLWKLGPTLTMSASITCGEGFNILYVMQRLGDLLDVVKVFKILWCIFCKNDQCHIFHIFSSDLFANC